MRDLVVRDADGAVFYAQLTYGSGMVMLGGIRDTDLDKLMRQPDEVGGIETQSCYLVVADADAHCAKAKAAGAEIVLDLKSDGLGRRGYSCRDPQGHIWNFGTYDPWRGRVPDASEPAVAVVTPSGTRKRLAAVALLAAMAIIGVATWWASGPRPEVVADRGVPDRIQERIAEAVSAAEREFRQDLAQERGAKRTAQLAAVAAREELARERTAKETAERAAEAAREELARERTAQEAAAKNTKGAPEGQAPQKTAQETGDLTLAAAREELARERTARETAKRAATEAELALAKERDARQDLEREVQEAQERATLAEQRRAAPIETSATRPAAEATWTTAAEDRAQTAQQADSELRRIALRVPRKRAVQTLAARRYKATYMTDLADVPWPFSAWYGIGDQR